jgi:hypothetical protein
MPHPIKVDIGNPQFLQFHEYAGGQNGVSHLQGIGFGLHHVLLLQYIIPEIALHV